MAGPKMPPRENEAVQTSLKGRTSQKAGVHQRVSMEPATRDPRIGVRQKLEQTQLTVMNCLTRAAAAWKLDAKCKTGV